MNIEELMIGDIVNIKCLNIEDEEVFLPGKITNVGESFVSATAIDDTYQFRCPEIFEGVPLTAEILEKSGFIRDPINIDHILDLGRFTVQYVLKYKVLNVYKGTTKFLTLDISCIHELQHALRLCGLADVANNLIVMGVKELMIGDIVAYDAFGGEAAALEYLEKQKEDK